MLNERALKIVEAAYGPDDPVMAAVVNNLGLVLKDMDDLAGAKAHYKRALKIDEAAYGPDHPEVAADLTNLGALLEAMLVVCFFSRLAIRTSPQNSSLKRKQMSSRIA